MRFKLYNKTAEKITSLGVTRNNIGDPFAKLVLTNDFNKYG